MPENHHHSADVRKKLMVKLKYTVLIQNVIGHMIMTQNRKSFGDAVKQLLSIQKNYNVGWIPPHRKHGKYMVDNANYFREMVTQFLTSVYLIRLLTKVVQAQQKTIMVLAKEIEGSKNGRI